MGVVLENATQFDAELANKILQLSSPAVNVNVVPLGEGVGLMSSIARATIEMADGTSTTCIVKVIAQTENVEISKGLNFYAIDEQPVDIIFLLLAPNEKTSEHLQALALISRLLRNNELTNKLRGCKNAESAMMVLTQTDSEQAA